MTTPAERLAAVAIPMRRPDTTYFFRAGDYIKVGCTGDVARRLKQLNRPAGRAALTRPADLPDTTPLTFMAAIRGGYRGEFRASSVLGSLTEAHVIGEWWRATPEVLDLIDQLVARDRAASP